MKSTRQYIIFSDGYVGKNKNRLVKGVKYAINTQDAKYYYVGNCKVDKSQCKKLYQTGEIL